MTERLFVYGSLGPGRPNEHVLATIGGNWEVATVTGTLRDEGWGAAMGYPGIQLGGDGGEIAGFLFSSEKLSEHWATLDEFEGPSYERVLTTVRLKDSTTIDAYVYALRSRAQRPEARPQRNVSIKLRPVVGSIVFFGVAPGVVAGWVPYMLAGWSLEEPILGVDSGRIFGGILVLTGIACLIDCFARFAIQGKGTPAPVAPTEHLIASGCYRYVRNPMYVAVVAIILGQALLLGSVLLFKYALLVWLACHIFVLAYEEPTLHKQFGESYRVYQAHVRRWWPRLRPWRGADVA